MQVICICFAVVLSYSNYDFEPWCATIFLTAYCLLLLAACCLLLLARLLLFACCLLLLKCIAHPDPEMGYKTSSGRPSSVTSTYLYYPRLILASF